MKWGGGQQRLLRSACACWQLGGVGGSALAGFGASAVARWRGNGCHSIGIGMLVSEEEGPDNQYKVEGVEGRQRGEHYKG